MTPTLRPSIHPGPRPLVPTIEDLLHLQPDTQRIDLPDADTNALYHMHPIAFHPDNGYRYALQFDAGPDFAASLLNGAGFHKVAHHHSTVWISTAQLEPQLQEMVDLITRHYPAASNRAHRAAHLVRERQVTSPDPDSHIYHVRSASTAGRVYRTEIPPDHRSGWVCFTVQDRDSGNSHLPCPDITNRAPTFKYGTRCKHMLAAWMTRRLRAAYSPHPRKETTSADTAAEAVPELPPNPPHPTTDGPDPQVATYGNGLDVSPNAAELRSFAAFVTARRTPPYDVAQLRDFYRLTKGA